MLFLNEKMCKANVFLTGKGYLTVFITNHANTVSTTFIPNTNLPKRTKKEMERRVFLDIASIKPTSLDGSLLPQKDFLQSGLIQSKTNVSYRFNVFVIIVKTD